MPAYQTRPARGNPGSDDASRITRRQRSRLRPECGHPAITPVEWFPAPPPTLRPLACARGFVPIPVFFGNVQASADTFGQAIDFQAAAMKIYIFMAAYAMDIGHPCCDQTNYRIAKATGINIGTVGRVIKAFEDANIISVEERPDGAGDPVRLIWILTALRPELPPELGGPDRSDPSCREPHRPAYSLFSGEDREPSQEACGQNDTVAPARCTHCAGATERPITVAPARCTHCAGAMVALPPKSAPELAQTGSGLEVASPGCPGDDPPALAGAGAGARVRTNVYVVLPPGGKTYTFAGEAEAPIAGEAEAVAPIAGLAEAPRPDPRPMVSPADCRSALAGPFGKSEKLAAGFLWSLIDQGEAVPEEWAGRIPPRPAEVEVTAPARPATPAPLPSPPVAPQPPAESRPKVAPTEEAIRRIYRTRDLATAADFAPSMARFIGDQRAMDPTHPDHHKSMNFHFKLMRNIAMGSIPLKTVTDAMAKARSETAESRAAVFVGHIKSEGGARKNGGRASHQSLPAAAPKETASMPLDYRV